MKTSSKWVVGVSVILGIAAYRSYQEQSCPLLTVHVIRHGETDDNKKGILFGSADISLNDAGRQQAAVLSDRLAPSSVRELYSSPQKRAHETALIIAEKLHVPIFIDERLNPQNFTSEKDFSDELALRDYVGQIISFFKNKAAEHKQEIYVIAHSGLVKSLFGYLSLVPGEDITVPNCSVFTFIYNPCSGHISYQKDDKDLKST